MENNYPGLIIYFLCTLVAISSCESQQQPYASPPGYNLNNPKHQNPK